MQNLVPPDSLYAVSGFCVGVLVGMTGVGGGSLMTPLLILLFGVNPTTAVGECASQGSGQLPQASVVLVPFCLELGRHILKMIKRDPRRSTLSPIVLLGF